MSSLFGRFARRKIVERGETTTELKRVLTTMDLTLLGIGSTLGIGIYVLAGSVAKKDAGPAVIISFLVAALASVLAGLCYAEFGARVPKAGSAYVYSYVCVGELIAFIVGWNLIMEYVIGVASVAKGYSGYVDSLCHSSMKQAFTEYFPLHVGFLSAYVDFFAFGITVLVTLVLAFGVKESTIFNNIFTCLNLAVVAFVVIAGSIFADPGNWYISPHTNVTAVVMGKALSEPGKIGDGGFAPFGFAGIMKGAATCFYGFVGFDCIATTGEEAKNPQRSIPLAIIFSLFFIFIAYFGISTVITMMVPYYLQDASAPLPEAFMYVDFPIGKWIVIVGAIFGLSTSLLGSMFPMPRVIYAMASDGLLFKFLSKVHPRFKTPLIATLIAGVFGGMMAAFFDLEALMDMMSIGTLTAYTLVAVCVLVLRYRKDEEGADDLSISSSTQTESKEKLTFSNYLGQIFNCGKATVPTKLSSSYSGIAVVFFCVFAIAFCATAVFAAESIMKGNIGSLIIFVILGIVLVLVLLSLHMQPVSRVKLTFKVPLVPVIPGASIVANVYLIMNLTGPTWIRFAVWMAIGFVIYAYCIWSGAADRAYAISVDDANSNKRKYSKVSVSSFQPGLSVHANGNGEKGLSKLTEGPEEQTEPEPTGTQLSPAFRLATSMSNPKHFQMAEAEDPLSSLEVPMGTGVYSPTATPCPPEPDELDSGEFVARLDLAEEDTGSERSRNSIRIAALGLVSIAHEAGVSQEKRDTDTENGPVRDLNIRLKDMCEKGRLSIDQSADLPDLVQLQKSKMEAEIYSSLNDLDKILSSADQELENKPEHKLPSVDLLQQPLAFGPSTVFNSELGSLFTTDTKGPDLDFAGSNADTDSGNNTRQQRKIGVIEDQHIDSLPVLEPGKAC